MNFNRKSKLLMGSLMLLMPVLFLACGGEEAPKTTQINTPEVVDTGKDQIPEAVAPTPEPAPEPAKEEVVEEVAEEVEEGSVSEDTTEVVPETMNSNDEVLTFFPTIQLGESMEMVVRAFAQENYMNLQLAYVGDADELMKEYEDNIKIVYCKNSRLEGIIILPAILPEGQVGIIILGKNGKIDSYIMPGHDTGYLKLPKDFPAISANFDKEKDLGKLAQFVNALDDCGIKTSSDQE